MLRSFYGVTPNGGTNGGSNPYGFGTVFRMTPDGKLTSLFSFNGTNGSWPNATLLLARDGNLYGSTTFGGPGFNGEGMSGFGTLFRISTAGEFTPLLAFNGTNGAYPGGAMTESVDGGIYGTTSDNYYMGLTNAGGHGTVFRISTNGQLSTIFAFNGMNGDSPIGKLLQEDACFYGTTWGGGDSNFGTIFRLTTNGNLNTLVHFAGTNGSGPIAGVVRGADGQLYGTTSKGGIGYGTVFRLTTNGSLTTLHSFNQSDGDYVDAALALGQDRVLYGTTANGGTPHHGQGNVGTIFQVTTNGAVTSLLAFNNMNGAGPIAELLPDGNGGFWGTTAWGGASSMPAPGSGDYQVGTIFRYGPGESPVMEDAGIQSEFGNTWLTFKWHALAGVFYGVQVNLTLSPQGWSNVTDPWTSEEISTVSTTDAVLSSELAFFSQIPFFIQPGEQRFYRLVLLPP